MMPKKPTYIDLFAGCGGLSLGLYHAGWQGLFAIEKSQDAFKTLKHNLIDSIEHFDWPDWLPIENSEIVSFLTNYEKQLDSLKRRVDLVSGGPPCQGFSTAGRRNENDERNKLIKSYIKFIRIVQPKIIFFENVKGFTIEFKKNKEKGRKYSSYVENALNRAGYYVRGELVNFGEYGVPQNRTRFILVGVRKDLSHSSAELARRFFELIKENRFSFLSQRNLSIETNLNDAISDLLKENGTVDSPDSRNFQAGLYSKESAPYQSYMRKGVMANVADSHRFSNHRPEIRSKFVEILKTCSKNKVLSRETRAHFNIKKHTVIPLDKNMKCPTITTLPDDYIHFSEPRILTVREYARIQSFPDWYLFKGRYTTGGKNRIHEVPRYSQIGNAIPPLFGEQSGLALKSLISL